MSDLIRSRLRPISSVIDFNWGLSADLIRSSILSFLNQRGPLLQLVHILLRAAPSTAVAPLGSLLAEVSLSHRRLWLILVERRRRGWANLTWGCTDRGLANFIGSSIYCTSIVRLLILILLPEISFRVIRRGHDLIIKLEWRCGIWYLYLFYKGIS